MGAITREHQQRRCSSVCGPGIRGGEIDPPSSPWRRCVFNFGLNVTHEDSPQRTRERLEWGRGSPPADWSPSPSALRALAEITWNTNPSSTSPRFWDSWMGHVCLCELIPWSGGAASISSPGPAHPLQAACAPPAILPCPLSWGLRRATLGVWWSWGKHPPGCWVHSCSSNLITPGRRDYLLSCFNS